MFSRILPFLLLLTNLTVEGGTMPIDPVKAIVGPNPALTWADCVRLTTAQNPDLQASRDAVLNSDAVRKGAYSALYPQIAATVSDTRSYTGAGLHSPSNYSTTYNEQLTLSQTIFNGFATEGNINQTRSELNLAFANLNEQKATVSFALKSAFAQLLYAQDLLTISQNVIEIRQNTSRLVKLLYDGGSEDKGAMLLSNANLDQAVNDLEQAIRTDELSGLQLAVSMGVDLPPPIRVRGELVTQTLPEKPDFRQLALKTPAYAQGRAQADAAAAGITIAKSTWYPAISAAVSTGRSDNEFPSRTFGWSAGIGGSLDVFDGGQTYFNVKAATALLQESLASLSSGTDQAALTLARSFTSLEDARDNVRIQKELLDASELRYKISQAQYRNGLMSFQDFNTITDSYVSQQQSYLAARRDAVIAEASWEQARGLGAIP